MTYLDKTYIHGIFCEIGTAPQAKATIILCPGLPGSPKEQSLLKKLMQEGYNVIYPRYRGTYESDGLFLQTSPADDICNVIRALQDISEYADCYTETRKQITIENIILLGSSFGGSVAMVCANLLRASCLCIAPVTDFANQGSHPGEQSIEQLAYFLTKIRHIYRFAPDGFAYLKANRLLPPLQSLTLQRAILIHGLTDATVHVSRSEALSRSNNIPLYLIPGGHLTLSDLSYDFLLEQLRSLQRF